jgi:hypothetical protein
VLPSADVATPVPTVNAAGKLADPPPGLEFVTVTVREPAAAIDDNVILARISDELFTTRLLTTISVPKSSDVTLEINCAPVTVTVTMLPRFALAGEMLEIVGSGLPTLKAPASVAVPPPGGAFVTLTSRAPIDAPAATEMFAVALVEEETVSVFTVTPDPNEAVVTPAVKFVPVIVTFNVKPRPPVVGLTEVKVGARFATVKALVKVDVPPPGAPFVTVTLRTPAIAPGVIVRAAVA